MKQFIILLFFILLVASKTHGNTDSLNHQTDSKTVDVVQIDKNESVDYKIIYDTQKDFNDRIISTVYWSLSSILIIILAIIGSNVFFNFRFNKKQYLELENELKQRIILLENSLVKKIDENVNESAKSSQKIQAKYQNEIQNQLDNKIKELTESYNERLDSFSKNLKEQIETLKERLDVYKNESDANNIDLKDLIKDLNEKLEEQSELAKHNLNDEILGIKIYIEELEAEIWKSKEIYGNALTRYISQSIYAINKKWEWKLKYSLPNIYEMLEKVSSLSEYNMERFEMLIPIIPNEYEIEKANIVNKIKSLPKDK